MKWKLMYRATTDGFLAKDFHRKCDFVANTLTVVKTTTGNIFGGFTTRHWKTKKLTLKDADAFIYSLVNKEDKPFKVMCPHYKFAIACNPFLGPSFGGNFEQCKMDFCIRTGSNTHHKSSSDFGNSYQHPDYQFGTDRTNSILAGSESFKTVEIEVFKQLFDDWLIFIKFNK